MFSPLGGPEVARDMVLRGNPVSSEMDSDLGGAVILAVVESVTGVVGRFPMVSLFGASRSGVL